MNYSERNIESYADWSNMPTPPRRSIAVDQAKFNLTWLVFPKLDEIGIDAIP